VLPPEKFSRKALVGAAWLPFFLLAGLMYFTVHTVVRVPQDTVTISEPAVRWWQVLLSVTVLPLGLTAPFGATILGWLAVGEIRRSRGRIAGLPLAVFDGLFYPLLVANSVLIWLWRISVRAMAEGAGASLDSGYWSAVGPVGAVLICLVVTIEICRRVWRAVKMDDEARPATGEWWWSSKAGGAVLLILCLTVIGIAANRRESLVRSGNLANQIAQRDAGQGRLIANLPGRGTVELLAVGERFGAVNGWWSADGTPLSSSLYEVRGGLDNVLGNRVPKEILFRASNLPEGSSFAGMESDPMSGNGSGGEVFLDGQRVQGGWPARFAWDPAVRSATVRLGYGLEPWRTIATNEAHDQSRRSRLPGDPNWTVNFHHSATETRDGAQIAVIFGPEDRAWSHRMVAVDSNGVAHAYTKAETTPVERLTLWTYGFQQLPLSAVKEFQLQVRPVHWVEFRDVALRPNASLPPPEPTASAELWSPEVAPGQGIDPGKIRDEANELMKSGDFEGALQRHIWFHHHATEFQPALSGVRLSFALSDWLELSRQYPKARRAVTEIRDAKARALDSGQGGFELFMDVASINQYLGDVGRTVALFKRIHDRDLLMAQQCFRVAREALVAAGEYPLCLEYIPDVQAEFERLCRERDDGMARTGPADFARPGGGYATTRFVRQALQLIEMLAGVGRNEEAEKIRVQAAAVVNAPEFQAPRLEEGPNRAGSKAESDSPNAN
jgi:hypothetical protein